MVFLLRKSLNLYDKVLDYVKVYAAPHMAELWQDNGEKQFVGT